MTDFDPQAVAEAASQPGTFSFVERITGRNYPTESVEVYLDEQAGYDRIKLANKAQDASDPDEARKIEQAIEEIDRKLQASKYTFVLRSFPPEEYDRIIDEVYEQYPAEYEVSVNPLSGRKVKEEKPNDDRNKLLMGLLWEHSIVKIIAPDGAVDESGVTAETANVIRGKFPVDGTRRIDLTIQNLRMVSEWMEQIQDEGFLATP